LRELPAAMRDVLLLAEFSSLRGAEIAAVLGIPAGTVASRKHHAMERLKTLLGEPDHA
jgi:RNA polymerase sigma-70 factor (ECF subfamily)